MDVTRLAGVALASAMIFACAGRAAPGATASPPGTDAAPPPVSVDEVQEEDGEALRS